MIKIGSLVEVVVDESIAAAKMRMGGCIIPSTAVIRGVLIPTPNYFPGYVTINRGKNYIANIPRKNIISITLAGGENKNNNNNNLPPPSKTYIIESKRTGEKYTVTEDGDKYSCTCVGFTYHGKCKHIKQVQSEKK